MMLQNIVYFYKYNLIYKHLFRFYEHMDLLRCSNEQDFNRIGRRITVFLAAKIRKIIPRAPFIVLHSLLVLLRFRRDRLPKGIEFGIPLIGFNLLNRRIDQSNRVLQTSVENAPIRRTGPPDETGEQRDDGDSPERSQGSE